MAKTLEGDIWGRIACVQWVLGWQVGKKQNNRKNPVCFLLCVTKAVLWKGFTSAEVCLWGARLMGCTASESPLCAGLCESPVSRTHSLEWFVSLIPVFVQPSKYTLLLPRLCPQLQGEGGLERNMITGN